MTKAALLALLVSISLYLGLGVRYGLRVRGLADILPMLFGKRARVANRREFSASTVAATISLATVLVAFYELVPSLGLWLLWTAVTTALGLLVFSLLVKRIWRKMSRYDYRPTLHAYLGTEFASKRLAFFASLFTAVGYLTAFAVELTVGSRFLAGLLNGAAPPLLVVALIAVVSFTYTAMGGFRVVVVTDRVQMWFIWLLLAALATYYSALAIPRGLTFSIDKIPIGLRTLTWNNGLTSFVLGIAVMNLLTYISNMGLWQRIAGSQRPEVATQGMWSSVLGAGLSWSLLVISAVGAFMFVSPVPHENLLVTLLKSMQGSRLGMAVIFCVVLGLYGAMFSTASTQLMAVSHTLYEDVLSQLRRVDLHDRAEQKSEVLLSRLVLIGSAILAVGVVEILRTLGFTVADMAFAVYGAALGLVPPILFTLFLPREVTEKLSTPAALAISLGFASCWAAATYGRVYGNANLVFLSPIISTAVASLIMGAGCVRLRVGPSRIL